MGTVQLGLIGESLVRTSLLQSGFRFAIPDHDTGIDLIAYREDYAGGLFPIQVKAVQKEAFYTNERLLNIPGLFIVYCWHIKDSRETKFIAMPYIEAERIVKRLAYRKKNGVFFAGKISQRLMSQLEPYIVADWQKVFPEN